MFTSTKIFSGCADAISRAGHFSAPVPATAIEIDDWMVRRATAALFVKERLPISFTEAEKRH